MIVQDVLMFPLIERIKTLPLLLCLFSACFAYGMDLLTWKSFLAAMAMAVLV